MIGQRFNRLIVIADVAPTFNAKGYAKKRVRVRCDCGNEKDVLVYSLKGGGTQSCGCLRNERIAAAAAVTTSKARRHGETVGGKPSIEYAAYRAMIQRCDNEKGASWHRYGGRGIKVCARWRHGENDKSGVECFIADMGRRPSKWHSLDRYPNNDGNYEPTNCRWATSFEQGHSSRDVPRGPRRPKPTFKFAF